MRISMRFLRGAVAATLAISLASAMGVAAQASSAPMTSEPLPSPSSAYPSAPTADPSPSTSSSTPDPRASPTQSAAPTQGWIDTATVPPAATPTQAAVPSPGPRAERLPQASVAPQGELEIHARWTELGGDAGPLGPATDPVACGLVSGGCLGRFTSGFITWTPTQGAIAVGGSISQRWNALSGVNGGLGYPVSEERCGLSGAGCSQSFEHGAIYSQPQLGTFEVWNGIWTRWSSMGAESGPLGYPIGVEKCGLRNGGCLQPFQAGAMYYVPGVGTNPVMNAINSRWAELGGQDGALGYPTGTERCGLAAGGCVQTFQQGGIYYAPGVGTNPVMNAINARWSALRAENGALGYPVEAEKCGLAGGGCQQVFQRGAIYYGPSAGTHAISGAFFNGYRSRGGPASALGYPTTDESCWAGACRQSFEYGTYDWTFTGVLSSSITPWGYCASLGRGAAKFATAGATRVSFAVAPRYGSTEVTFVNCVRQSWGYALEWATRGSDGENGFARPGVATGPTTGKLSPTGSFSVTEAFGLSNPGTSLPYRTLNPYSRWGGRLNSNYNQYFESSADIFPDENMWYYATRPQGDYRQGAVINYNRPPDAPITMNAGFAIFLHANNVGTWGCISLSESDVVRYLRSAAPGDRLIMGVDADVFM